MFVRSSVCLCVYLMSVMIVAARLSKAKREIIVYFVSEARWKQATAEAHKSDAGHFLQNPLDAVPNSKCWPLLFACRVAQSRLIIMQIVDDSVGESNLKRELKRRGWKMKHIHLLD